MSFIKKAEVMERLDAVSVPISVKDEIEVCVAQKQSGGK